MLFFVVAYQHHTLPKDKPFNLEFQIESVFKLEFQSKFGIQLGIPILVGLNLGECIHGSLKQRITCLLN